jgi:hypothetical protein
MRVLETYLSQTKSSKFEPFYENTVWNGQGKRRKESLPWPLLIEKQHFLKRLLFSEKARRGKEQSIAMKKATASQSFAQWRVSPSLRIQQKSLHLWAFADRTQNRVGLEFLSPSSRYRFELHPPIHSSAASGSLTADLASSVLHASMY